MNWKDRFWEFSNIYKPWHWINWAWIGFNLGGMFYAFDWVQLFTASCLLGFEALSLRKDEKFRARFSDQVTDAMLKLALHQQITRIQNGNEMQQ